MKPPTKPHPRPEQNRNYPGNCYKGLIEPIAGLQLKGAIFHQGYNNCFNYSSGARMYRQLFPEMIASWRAAFRQPDMPFGIISLCTAGDAQTEENYLQQMVDVGPELREAQYRTFLEMRKAGDENIGFASGYDFRRRWFHPQLKVPAGERMARWALDTQYGVPLKWLPPEIIEVKPVDGALHLKFNGSIGPVDDGDKKIKGFAVAGENRQYQLAEVNYLVTGQSEKGYDLYDNTVLVLRSPLVENPVHFRYAWARNPMGNVQSPGNSSVPLATQRSDHWAVTEGPISTEGKNGRQAARALRELYQEVDLKRRQYEAQQLLEKAKTE